MEFRIYAATYSDAKVAAYQRVADFLEIPVADVDDYAAIEIRYDGNEHSGSSPLTAIDVYVRITHV